METVLIDVQWHRDIATIIGIWLGMGALLVAITIVFVLGIKLFIEWRRGK